jgi:energy-converting hydrogenase A subunit P
VSGALELAYEACVRTLSRNATCTACRDACPTHAVALDGSRGSVTVALERCTGCGLCAAACPTDALTAPFDLAATMASSDGKLSCGADGLPCVGALSTEDLIALATRVKAVVLQDGPCASRDLGHPEAARRAAEAQRFLDAVGIKATVRWAPDEALPAPTGARPEAPPAPGKAPEVSAGRRRLLRMFVPTLEAAPQAMLQQPDRLDRARMQQVPARRRRLLAALPPGVEARTPEVPGPALGFLSSKVVDERACTACTICFNVCPTGALQAPRSLKELRFDASRCTRCGLCHEVCEPEALRLAPRTSVEDFLEFAPRTLARLPVTRCGECGVPYNRAEGGAGLCPRCWALEEEAMELNGGGS